MKIMAIDPGYDRVGIAIVDGTGSKPLCLFSECFLTQRGDTAEQRLAEISRKIEALIRESAPEAVALETLYFSVNQKTALGVAEARGVILAQAGLAGIPVFSLNPNQVKLAVTSYGASKKSAVTEMVKRLVKTRTGIKFDDEYDAIAIGIAALALRLSI